MSNTKVKISFVGTMMAALFYRGVDLDKIEEMSYRKMKMYYDFHLLIDKEWNKEPTTGKQNGG